jgi:hypothetical protein
MTNGKQVTDKVAVIDDHAAVHPFVGPIGDKLGRRGMPARQRTACATNRLEGLTRWT